MIGSTYVSMRNMLKYIAELQTDKVCEWGGVVLRIVHYSL